MMKKTYLILIFIIIFFASMLNAQRKTDIFRINSPNWIQTKGPQVGYISNVLSDPTNPSLLYALGSVKGIFKSTNGGEHWELVSFTEQLWKQPLNGIIDPISPNILYCSSNLDLIKSSDEGMTWQSIFNNIEDDYQYARVLKMASHNHNVLYVGGGSHSGEAGGTVHKTENGGATWTTIGNNIPGVPNKAMVETIGIAGDEKLFAGINDINLQTWHKGKVFYTTTEVSLIFAQFIL